jgi:acetylornithine deacetylase/succinyl-diaminopimelate desuccinylase-like protein
VATLDDYVAHRLDYASDLLMRLVAEPSTEGSGAIERCLDLIETELAPVASEILRPEHDGLRSLIVRFGPADRRPALAFSGHVDVVPAEGRWSTPPFELAHVDGRLRGRGVCDMKGGVAAFVTAMHCMADAGTLARCPIELILTGDEEVGSARGLIPLLKEGMVRAPAAICGEPTGLAIFLGNRGLIWIEIRIRGRGGHAGMAQSLANPIDAAVALIAELARLPLTARDSRFTPPTPSLTVTGIRAADEAVNTVPDEALLTIDRRLVPGEDLDSAADQILEAVEDSIDPKFEHEVAILRRWPPYAIAAEEEVVQVARDAVRVAGRPAELGMDLASNDSSWLDQAGVTTLLMGPGAPRQAHATDEELDPGEFRDAIAIYARVAAILAGEHVNIGPESG